MYKIFEKIFNIGENKDFYHSNTQNCYKLAENEPLGYLLAEKHEFGVILLLGISPARFYTKSWLRRSVSNMRQIKLEANLKRLAYLAYSYNLEQL